MKLPSRTPTQDISIARWIARISGLALTALFAVVITTTQQPILFSATIGAMTVCLLIGWRWEKIGGALIFAADLICAFLVGLNATLSVIPNLGIAGAVLWGVGCMVAVALIWFLPYELLAWLMISIGRRADRPAQPPAQERLPDAKAA